MLVPLKALCCHVKWAEGYPAVVAMAHSPQYYRRKWCAHAHQIVTAFAFRAQAPLFDRAPFCLIGTPVGERTYLEAKGPDGMTTMTTSVDLAGKVPHG